MIKFLREFWNWCNEPPVFLVYIIWIYSLLFLGGGFIGVVLYGN